LHSRPTISYCPLPLFQACTLDPLFLTALFLCFIVLKLSDISTQDKVVLHFESKDQIFTVGNFRSTHYQEGSYTVRLATILPVGTLTVMCVSWRQLHSQIMCVSTWIFGFGKLEREV